LRASTPLVRDFLFRQSATAPFRYSIERNGANDDRTGDELRIVEIDTVENEPAIDRRDDQHAKRGANDRS
jgi:hypothetical protein